MPSRRDQIKLTAEEQLELLDAERIVVCTTNGPRGWPHSMPLWYTVRDGDVWSWTFAKSQKVRNLERDPRCTLLVEAGVEYGELRGVQIEAEAELIRDPEQIYELRGRVDDPLRGGDRQDRRRCCGGPRAQAPKRVAIHFRPVRTATWDHRKLGGTY